MNVRRRDIGLLPATEGSSAAYRVSVVVNGRVCYIDVEARLTVAEREEAIAEAIETIKRGDTGS